MKGSKLIFCVHEANIMLFDIPKTHCIIFTQTVRKESHEIMFYFSILTE
jgi:hypothetical protein